MAGPNRLRGFVNQSMSGKKPPSASRADAAQMVDTATPGAGSLTVARNGVALIYLEGPGGSGDAASRGGGGGGAALCKKFRVTKGQVLSWTVGTPGAAAANPAPGNDGSDTTLTLPNGVVLTAGAGKGGAASGGLGGIASGGDVNRTGGAGGSSGGAGSSAPDAGGGAGGASGVGSGGGGGAGFGDIGSPLAGGPGSAGASNSGAGGAYGGGSGAGSFSTGAGGSGRVLIWIVRVF